MADESPPVEESFLNLLGRLRKLGPGCPPFEDVRMTPSQLTLLDWIAGSPGCGVQDIATGLNVTAPTVSVGVRRLEEAGLLERQPDPQDRRAIRLFLTPQGQALHRQAQNFRLQKVRRLLANLTSEEQTTLLALLEKALSAAEAETSHK